MKKRQEKNRDESLKAFVGVVLVGLFAASLYVIYYFINHGGTEMIDILMKN